MVHTHIHTDGSQLDGAIQLNKLFPRLQELGQSSIAITDHGNMSNVIPAMLKSKDYGIKVLPGIEFYINGGHHLLAIAKNNQGLRNLFRLSRLSYLPENFYYKPNIKTEMLLCNRNGLIVTTACLGSEWGELIIKGNVAEAKKLAQQYKEAFGDDFYIEIQTNQQEIQKTYNRYMIEIAEQLDIKITVSSDAHYLKKEDAYAHEVLLAMQTGKKMSDENRFRFSGDDYYVLSDKEIQEKLSYLNPTKVIEYISNTHEISDKVDVTLDLSTTHAPHFNNLDFEEEKLELANRMNEWYQNNYKTYDKEVVERIQYELSVINSKHFAGYYLIVADYINAFQNITVDTYGVMMNLITGPGRGSGVGSLVAYALGITKLNPLKYGLLFERFLNPERLNYPDFDSDFDYEYRHMAINYITNTYGADKTARVAAWNTNQTKQIFRRVMSVFGVEQQIINKIARMIPESANNLDDSLLIAPEFKWQMSKFQKELDVMRTLEGMISAFSTHAAGIVIGDTYLDEYAPMHSDSEDRNHMILSLDKYDVEKVGLIKHDILGLKTLTILRRVLARIYKKTGSLIDLWSLDYSDSKVYESVRFGDLLGMFQIDGDSAIMSVQQVQPDCFDDIVAIEAICRPGVKEAKKYIENKQKVAQIKAEAIKQGKSVPDMIIVEPVHPIVDEVLEETYGAIVYQEQTMLIMNRLTGGRWSLGKADKMRKVKNLEEYRDDFVSCCIENDVLSDVANAVFDRFSLEYSFNKSHAVAYAAITFATAWLKTYYTAEYMAEYMSMYKEDQNLMSQCIWEIKKSGIKVLPPDINATHSNFDEKDGAIVYGLLGIKDVGESAVVDILKTSKEKCVESLKDFFDRVNKRTVKKNTMIALIKCGVFDFENTNRNELLKQYFDLRGEKVQMSLEDDANEKMEWEKHYLGIYLTSHPLDKYYFKPYKDIEYDGLIGGIVNEFKVITTRNNKEMAFLKLETVEGIREITIFPDIYSKYSDILVIGNIIMSRGNKDPKDNTKWIASKLEVL